jgi:serine protease
MLTEYTGQRAVAPADPVTVHGGAEMNSRKTLSAMVVAAAITISGQAEGETYVVPGDYPTIQAAILAALEGDEVLVLPGIYNEAVFLNGHNIILRSTGGPDVTTIDGTGLGSYGLRVLLGEGPETLIEGFTLTGSSYGLQLSSSSPTIRNCRFS